MFLGKLCLLSFPKVGDIAIPSCKGDYERVPGTSEQSSNDLPKIKMIHPLGLELLLS